MYNVNRKSLLYNKIHCKRHANNHPHPLYFCKEIGVVTSPKNFLFSPFPTNL